MKKIYSILLCIGLVVGFVACEKDKDFVLTQLTVQNETITPSYGSATIDCTFKADATISEAFVQYALSSSFAKYDVAKMTEEKGKYVAQLTDLQDNTTYYIRYAVSNKYSSAVTEEVMEFQTLPCTAPTIALDSIADVWDNRAKAYLHLIFDGGASVTDMGICWSKQANPTIEDIHKSTKDTVAVLDMTDLQPNTQYYIRAYAVNRVGVSYSEEQEFTTYALPEVRTEEVADIQENTALLSATLLFDGNDTATIKGFCWSDKANPTIEANHITIDTTSAHYTYLLSALMPATEYHVRAYATNRIGIVYGEEVVFTMPKQVTLPIVVTANAIEVTETSAKVEGFIPDDGNASIMDKGIVYSTNHNPTTNDDKVSLGSGSGAFTCTLLDLQPNTTYYARAYATNSKGTAYGNEVSFTTKEEQQSTSELPIVTTFAVTKIAETSAEAGGDVKSAGSASVTDRGVVYSLSANPSIDNLNSTIVRSGSGTGAFVCNLSNLQQGTTYYIRAYAVNSVGTSYGEELTFTTAVPITLATVTTSIVTQITENSALAGGTVTNTGGTIVLERGVCVATVSNPTIANTKIAAGSGVGTFTCNLTGLQPNTTYYVRAYAVNSKGTAYGEEVTFTTKANVNISDPTGTENGYGYVDLGLSVKWATMNVGASSPEDYGDYFAWGEIEPKEFYDWSTYKYCNGSSSTLTKYHSIDNKNQLELSDDAAHVSWGGTWRMPTTLEQDELRENCSWTWITINGIKGYKVTSKINNNSIFLPAAGNKYRWEILNPDIYGLYWSSTLCTDTTIAFSMDFHSSSIYRSYRGRYEGQSVRPVLGEYIPEAVSPTITTTTVTQITETSAVAGGNVTSDGGASVTERGVVYSTNPNPVITNLNNTIRPCGSGTGAFTYNMTGLQSGTTYYVRAYAKNEVGTAYGEEVSFTTQEQSSTPNNGTENGYAYVDLGLSVKWATMNVGANKPEEYGDYFAWGETMTKSTYNWSTYKYCNGSYDSLTKYNNSNSYGTVDNKTTLELSDDAAYKNWGGSWRMPTDAEWTELSEQCTWTWTNLNGVDGYMVTSKKSGYTNNSIFLPAAGYRNGSSLNNAGSYGDYWSSSLLTNDPGYAWSVGFNSSDVYRNYSDRFCGLSVRPVLGENEVEVTTPTVTTATVTQITETTAVAGGTVTNDGNASVTERGVVYSTNTNPVITNLNNTIRPCGSGTGSFTYNMTGLQSGTTYYVRAYAKNDVGTAYGEEVSFTTKVEVVDNPPYNSALPFSVSASKQVYFSKGNLQYHPANNEWRFAENQTDYIGNANSNCSSTYNGWLDLFGWSTSTTNFGVSTSTDDNDYSGSFVDWGTNKIGNDVPNTWRTLTYGEWDYLRSNRTNANDLCGIAQVNGVNGLIFLPDNWTCPAGVTFKSGFNSSSATTSYAAYQTFTADQWSKLESAGAVFLPAAGFRNGTNVDAVQGFGYCWSATESGSGNAYCLYFYSNAAYMGGSYRRLGRSVRLVKDL